MLHGNKLNNTDGKLNKDNLFLFYKNRMQVNQLTSYSKYQNYFFSDIYDIYIVLIIKISNILPNLFQ